MKTKAQIILFVLCFLSYENKAQVYFSNRYDTFGSCDLTNHIDTFSNNYLTVGITCSPISYYALNLKLYNENNGVVNHSKTYNWYGNNFENANGFNVNSNRYLLCGTRYYHTDTSLVFQWAFDKNLDSIKYREYGYLNKGNFVNKIINYSNKNYFMVGQVYDNLFNSDILIIKTDTAGNEIWKKTIGVTGIDESALSIDTIQNELIISGYQVTHSSNNYSGFVIRLDTAGNLIWNKNVNTNFGSGCGIKKLNDGNILIISSYREYIIGSNDYLKLQVEKITPNNISIWKKKYNAPQMYSGPNSIIENKHGNIVIAGQIGFYSNMINGKLNEITQNGDSLFSKEYAIIPNSQNYLKDIIQTSDGGYCLSGFVTPLSAYGGTGTEDVWLLKIDSNFCESSTPCGYGVGIKELNKNFDLRLYPNPANSSINIELLNFDNDSYLIEIFNEFNQIIFSEKSTKVDYNIITKNITNGMYYFIISTKNSRITKKVIIQH